MSKDTLHRYTFANANVRGELVQLHESYQAVIAAHEYPAVINKLLGQLMAATALLTATLKFKGDISVQLQGNGPVSLAVINGNHLQQLRGVSRWNGELADDLTLQQLFGQGHMVITLTPAQGERYQGVVALDKETFAECIESYFEQSEQLPTKLWLFADEQNAAGAFLQILPDESSETDHFEHLSVITSTVKADELYELPATEVLHRLYHEEEVTLYEPVDITFKCTCSKEKSAGAIRTVSKSEVDDIIQEHGKVEMGCEYCNSKYIFDAIDIEAIFTDIPTNTTQQ